MLRFTPVLNNGAKRSALNLGRNYLRGFGSMHGPRVAVSTLIKRDKKPNGFRGMLALFVGIGTLAVSGLSTNLYNDQNVKEDPWKSVSVDKSIDPFPTELKASEFPISTEYVMLGFGIRSVTFISFKVYGLGIYAAKEDLGLIPKVLDSNFLSTAFIDFDSSKSHKENLKTALDNPETSRILINNLLDSGIRLVAKITPIRNTDFNHLKDGLVKSILGHPDSKKDEDRLTNGLQQLRDAFSRKGSVPKNNDLLIELQANGYLQVSYFDRKTGESTTMGQVKETLIGKLLFSQYLSGPKPLSPSTKDSVVSKLVTLA
ncbi:Aim46 [Kluyveromyces lactis]|nr:Aim46 [Kluyveromyces lactis]